MYCTIPLIKNLQKYSGAATTAIIVRIPITPCIIIFNTSITDISILLGGFMKVFVKIISLILVFAIAFSCLCIPGFASSDFVSAATLGVAWYDLIPIIIDFGFDSVESSLDDLRDYFSDEDVLELFNHYCNAAYEATDGLYPTHYFGGDGFWLKDSACIYCGLSYSDFRDGVQDSYTDYVESLTLTEVSTDADYFQDISLPTNIASASGASSLAINSISGNKVTFSGVTNLESLQYITFKSQSFKWPYASGNYSITSEIFTGCLRYYTGLTYGYKTPYDFRLYNVSSGTYTDPVTSSTSFASNNMTTTSCHNITYSLYLTKGRTYQFEYKIGGYPSEVYGKTRSAGIYSITAKTVYVDPSTMPEEDSRFAYLFHLVSDYNKNNSYTDNSSVVNIYLSDGSSLYDPSLFTESSMIFTEPKTGAQFQCENWTYDYNLRSYALDLVDGSMTADGANVEGVTITYGDDALTVRGWAYDDSSTLQTVFEDTYQYTVVAQDSCTIHGHTNTVETTKEPTCIASGERVYTCSTCGNQVVEDIPMLGHSFNYEVLYDSTCSAVGTGIYTCSTCGTQYTETIPKKEHVYEVKERVDTVYDEEGVALEAGYTVYQCQNCNNEYTETDDVEIKEETLFNWLFDILKTLITGIIDALSAGLEFLFTDVFGTILEIVLEFARWVFDLLDLSSLREFFNWWSDDNPYFQEEFAAAAA